MFNGMVARFGAALSYSGIDSGPQSYLNLDGRGGTGPNGKPSYTIDEAAAQITRYHESLNGSFVTNTPASVTYGFRASAPSTMPNGTGGFSQFNADQIAGARLALQSWSDVANVQFTEVNAGGYTDSADILFGNYSTGAAGAAAFAYYPSSGSDVWVNVTYGYNADPVLLDYGRNVLVHEIGHAIGLAHPGDYNAGTGTPTYDTDAVYYEDSRQYTVMSYWSETNTGGDNFGEYAAAPLLDDIAAIQLLYGANMTTRTGDTTYGFNSTAGRDYYAPSGAFNDVVFAVWDAGGTDTLDFSGYSHNQTIDLRQGYFSNVGELTGNVAIAVGAVIENAIGGSGSDVITGNSSDNVLSGNDGNDSLYGAAGADTLDGGAGADVMVGGLGNDLYVVENYGDQVSEDADAGTDTVQSLGNYTLGDNVENLTLTGTNPSKGIGNSLDNLITGNDVGNILRGGGGSDELHGAGGSDWLYGGAGVDVIYGGDGDDIYIVDNVADRTIELAGAGTDLVQSSVSLRLEDNVENLTLTGSAAIDGIGNDLANLLTGNDSANTLRGGGGTDVLHGGQGDDWLYGGASADTMYGGLGNDTYIVDDVRDVASENASSGTDFVLSSVSYTLGANLENVTLTGTAAIDASGNSLANVVNGNDAANVLRGGGGADQLHGGQGADSLHGGAGSDFLTGGAGADIFYFDTSLSATTNVDTITDFSVADDIIDLSHSLFSQAGSLGTLSSKAFFAGTAAHDADDRIIYDSGTGNLYYDADGSGAVAAILFGHVASGLALTNADFHIIG